MELLVAANANDILMVEGEMQESSEEDMLTALRLAHDAIKVHCAALVELTIEVGKTEKRVYCHETHDEELRKSLWEGYSRAGATAARLTAEGLAAAIGCEVEDTSISPPQA